jgi:hypothetical protein
VQAVARELVQGGGRRARTGLATGELVQERWPASSSRGGGRRARPWAAGWRARLGSAAGEPTLIAA